MIFVLSLCQKNTHSSVDCTSFMTLSQSLSHKVMVLQDVLFGVTEVRQHRYSLRVPLPRLCASLHAWVCPCKNRPLKGPAATQPSLTRGLFSSIWWQYSKKHGMGEHAVFLIRSTEKSCIFLSQKNHPYIQFPFTSFIRARLSTLEYNIKPQALTC